MAICLDCDYDDEGNSEGCSGPPKEEPDCYACNDAGCMACDPYIEGPRLPWWWFRLELPVRGFATADADGWPMRDGVPLLDKVSYFADEVPF